MAAESPTYQQQPLFISVEEGDRQARAALEVEHGPVFAEATETARAKAAELRERADALLDAANTLDVPSLSGSERQHAAVHAPIITADTANLPLDELHSRFAAALQSRDKAGCYLYQSGVAGVWRG